MKKILAFAVLLVLIGCKKKDCPDPVFSINGVQISGNSVDVGNGVNFGLTASIPGEKGTYAYNWTVNGEKYSSAVLYTSIVEETTVNLTMSNGSCTVTGSITLSPNGALCSNANEPNNNSTSGAVTLTLGTPQSSAISSYSDLDYFKVVTTNSAPNLSVTLGNLPTNYDLYLYSSSGYLLGSSTNGGNTEENILYNESYGNTYYILVRTYDSYNETSCYEINANGYSSSFCIDYNEPNNTLNTGEYISTGYNYTGSIASGTDLDYFYFYSGSGNTATVTLNMPGYYDLELYDNSGNVIGVPAGGSTYTEVLTAGLSLYTYYYLRVKGVTASDYNPAQCYTVRAEVTSSCANNYESNNTLASAYSINLGSTYSAGISSGTDQDYYSVYTGNKNSLTITLNSLASNYHLALYNSSNVLIGSSTNSGSTAESITAAVSMYTYYYIRVYPATTSNYSNYCYNLYAN